MDSVVVSVRIKRAQKANLEKEGIDVERAIKEYLDHREAQVKLKGAIKKSIRLLKSAKVKPSKAGFGARSVREDRDAN